MIDWKVYYGDGSALSNEQVEADHLPGRNVVCVVNRHPDVGKQIVTRHDYYWFEQVWFGGDLFGLYDYLLLPGWKKVLFGRTLPTKDYEDVIKAALNDKDFPAKSAKLPRENL